MRHLHHTYHLTWCGKDASFIPMAHDPSEAECETCLKKHAAHHEAVHADIERNRKDVDEARTRREQREADRHAKSLRRLERLQQP